MKTHVTKDGTEIPICNLTTSHLMNIIKWIDRKAEDGMPIYHGFYGSDDPSDGEVEIIYDDAVREEMGYRYYVDELKRRTE